MFSPRAVEPRVAAGPGCFVLGVSCVGGREGREIMRVRKEEGQGRGAGQFCDIRDIDQRTSVCRVDLRKRRGCL